MSLIPDSSSTSSGGVAQPDRTIAVEGSSGQNLYTVPNGRKFVGYFNVSYGASTSAMQLVSPDGATISYYFGSERQAYFPLTLLAGWTVKTWSYQGAIIGTETNA